MKKIISILIVCSLLVSTGCSSKEGVVIDPPAGESTTVTSSAESGDPKESSSSEAVSSSSETISGGASQTTSEEVSQETSSDVSGTSSVTSSEEKSEPASTSETTSSEPTPAWTETQTSGTMYINTDNIYSRAEAIQGSATVKKYSLNDKITVVAVTDTDYYKLSDGSFIHKDYLSNKETTVTPPASTASSSTTTTTTTTTTSSTKPSTPASSSSTTAQKPATPAPASPEKLINSAPLNPMKTNEPDVDAMISEVMGKIIKNNMSTYQKVVAIYDYIINTSTYQAGHLGYTDVGYCNMLDYYIAVNAYTLLESHEGVCDNYSSLFVAMTRAIGLETYVCMGQVRTKSGGRTGHVWTVMKLDGEYYTFDPQIEQNNLVNGKIQYNYFCRTEDSVSTLYTYDISDWFIEECAYYAGVKLNKNKPRASQIALFGNFEVDGVRKPFHNYYM